jgi:hypothetical protein
VLAFCVFVRLGVDNKPNPRTRATQATVRLGKGESISASLRKATEFESLVPQTDSCTTTKLGALAIYFLTWKAVQLLRTGPIERVV